MTTYPATAHPPVLGSPAKAARTGNSNPVFFLVLSFC